MDEWRGVLGCGHVGTGEESSREYDVIGPVLMVEILSPTNKTETWTNVWAYTTIPTVRSCTASAFERSGCGAMVPWSWQA